MLQLKNSTPFAAEMATFPNEHGIDSLYVIVKGTFEIGEQWSLAVTQAPPQMADEYWGEPGESSIKVLSDIHIGKPSTDILIQGNACALDQQLVSQLDVNLQIGAISKSIRVFGDRHWNNQRISDALPFQEMPLVYERAFGGTHYVSEQEILVEERNPVGCGFAGKRKGAEMNGISLPNLEDINNLISHFSDKPIPACFAPCSSNWVPRVQWSGTYDGHWQTTRAPYLPDDFDKRFLNAAHPDLIYPGYLLGGEFVMVQGMHPSGEIKFNVPQVKLNCDLTLKNTIVPIDFNLETLTILPNQKQISMVWLASFECDKNILNITNIEVKLSR
ncbi:DUF2169 domain-containing protein [Psychromonas sp.]|nr:DUF2169 domain-containing protein [Psychromonas sp.]